MVNLVGADALMSTLYAKYHYLFWRPVTAIDPTAVTADGFGRYRVTTTATRRRPSRRAGGRFDDAEPPGIPRGRARRRARPPSPAAASRRRSAARPRRSWRGNLSLTNMTPWPTNTSSSMVTPSQTKVWLCTLQRAPILAPRWISTNGPDPGLVADLAAVEVRERPDPGRPFRARRRRAAGRERRSPAQSPRLKYALTASATAVS